MPASAEVQAEALGRAAQGQSLINYPEIFRGMMAKGIPEADIRPRENVFTFNAWRALGRTVRKGEHGVQVLTWIPTQEKKDAAGEVTHKAGRRPKNAYVFHLSQTEALNAAREVARGVEGSDAAEQVAP
mgnify:CR=1 FL=1